MEPLTGVQLGGCFRPDAPCYTNDVLPRRPHLVDELAADTATSSKDGDAHGPLSLTSATVDQSR